MPMYRKKPVEVEARQWTGDNLDWITGLTGSVNYLALSDADRANCDDPEATAMVFDKYHHTWILVYTGDYVIRGIDGETYPCRETVFHRTYEAVDPG
jgi:hypothetical protein